jgi:hypothetical protein
MLRLVFRFLDWVDRVETAKDALKVVALMVIPNSVAAWWV